MQYFLSNSDENTPKKLLDYFKKYIKNEGSFKGF